LHDAVTVDDNVRGAVFDKTDFILFFRFKNPDFLRLY